MRTLPILALALLLLAPAASAQMSFSQPYQLRAALGDIPTTTAVEPANAFNVEQRITLTLENTGGPQTFSVAYPKGATVLRAETSTGLKGIDDGEHAVFDNLTAGDVTFFVATTQPVRGSAFATDVESPGLRGDAAIILYVPTGGAIDTGAPIVQSLPCTDGKPCTIQVHTGTAAAPLPNPFWMALHPATTGTSTVTVSPAPAGTDFSAMLPWLVGAFALGALLWALLVSRGMVQAKSRRQVAATAAHVEAAHAEPTPVLEGKKRALLAALKEVELARQANEMPAEVYDQVKADLKKQAVTVMRAIEEAGSKT